LIRTPPSGSGCDLTMEDVCSPWLFSRYYTGYPGKCCDSTLKRPRHAFMSDEWARIWKGVMVSVQGISLKRLSKTTKRRGQDNRSAGGYCLYLWWCDPDRSVPVYFTLRKEKLWVLMEVDWPDGVGLSRSGEWYTFRCVQPTCSTQHVARSETETWNRILARNRLSDYIVICLYFILRCFCNN
jgi:hypothetical protein